MAKDFHALQRFGHGVFTDGKLQDKCVVVRDKMQLRPQVETPAISVVVPAHREEKYILAMLMSLAQQTHDACEFVIVCNGEPEGNRTQQLCREAGFNVINEPRKGIALGRDIGLHAAKGRIVASTDADTIHHPEWLQVVDDYFEREKCVGAYGPLQFLGLSVRRQIYIALVAFYKRNFEVLKDRGIPGPNSYFLRELALEVGGYDRTLAAREDTEIFERILPEGGVPFIQDERAKVYTSGRRLNATSIMRSLTMALHSRGIIGGASFSKRQHYLSQDVR